MSLPVAHVGVIYQRVADGAVLLHSEAEVYFGLNAVGARVWELLAACGSLDELCESLHAEYPSVAPEVLRADVVELLNELRVHGLVDATEGAGRDGGLAVSVG